MGNLESGLGLRELGNSGKSFAVQSHWAHSRMRYGNLNAAGDRIVTVPAAMNLRGQPSTLCRMAARSGATGKSAVEGR
jgi:hypothetical protein